VKGGLSSTRQKELATIKLVYYHNCTFGIIKKEKTVKTISLKLPGTLHAKLARAAKSRKTSKSELMRAALDQFLNNEQRPSARRTVSALELAGDLVGCIAGPGDLSTNPKYMEGFGK
jgi:Arc/MetJ-type ribon-helix-helix transcriptional regulator